MAHRAGAPDAFPDSNFLGEGQFDLRAICADFARRERQVRACARAEGLTRREFLETLAAGAAAAGVVALGWPTAAAAQGAAARSRVVVVTHPEVLVREYRVNPPIVREMLDRALVELTGARTEKDAWRTFARDTDLLAVKHNSIGAPTLQSHTEINDAIVQQMEAQVGLLAERIVVVDRRVPEPYRDFSDPFTLPSNGLVTRLRRLYTDHATGIVNVSVLKAHYGEGLSAAMKNHLGSVNNPAQYHGWEPTRMPRNLPELNALEPLRTKTRLCIVDAIRPLYAGGPADEPNYRWDYRGLIVGTDPVAVTAVGMRILEAKRQEAIGKEWPMTAAREMVAYAQGIGLGNADPTGIDLVEAKMG